MRLRYQLHRLYRYRSALAILLFCLLAELLIHRRSFHVSRPSEPLDLPYQYGCQNPTADAHEHESAIIVMLARNSELAQAVSSLTSLEAQFNKWFKYPILLLNGEVSGFSDEFKNAIDTVWSGNVTFENIKRKTWGFPDWIDVDRAHNAFKQQEVDDIIYGGLEDYHHMCRFYSGPFFQLQSLRQYRWYWRVEPGVEFTCAITYDPFKAMADANKTYGYTIALWELPQTGPSLFNTVSAHKDAHDIGTSNLWRSVVDPSWAPWGIRSLIPSKTMRDAHGDSWSLCHYWGNFEIADLDFFRSQRYQDYFKTLDRAGGFYYERWGDAPIRSLGAALFLEPEQLHFFQDFGYRHGRFQHCPKNARNLQMPEIGPLGAAGEHWSTEYDDGSGCRCYCDPYGWTNRPICRDRLRRGVDPG